uniref:Interferon regulatory factor like protein n=1 Tax=Ciona intestinalis TaxID=7719 RepID=Q4H3B0_CIOIN|nr:interferon regulatory factor like protein [Ciona intestinalis]BAE06517.1 interferon regulatory factor like protein [Ciona intestinalis]|eukprot:NP_001071745.1 interferon regulatory factor like protein [Ciona intestinalis]
MATSQDREFKLTLRNWLFNRLNEETYGDALKWDGNNKGVFHILWTKKGDPNWENHFQIFVGWAKHKDRFDCNSPINYDKLKSNFRNLIKKTTDFEEIENVRNQQTGNRKVYRFRSKEEIKAIKKLQSPKDSSPDSATSQDSQDTVEEMESVLPELSIHDTDMFLPQEQLNEVDMNISVQAAGQQQSNVEGGGNSITFSEFLAGLNIDCEDLPKFTITVQYKNKVVVPETAYNLAHGIRLFHGNLVEQNAIAESVGLKSVVQQLANCPTLELPVSEDRLVQRVLNELGLGIVFLTNEQAHALSAMRFGRSHLYCTFYGSHALQKVDRTTDQEIKFKEIFNYQEQIRAMLENHEDPGKRTSPCEIICLIGSRKNIISVTIRPVISDTLTDGLFFSSQMLSISHEASLDRVMSFMKGSFNGSFDNSQPSVEQFQMN